MITLSNLGYGFTATEIIKRAGTMMVSILVAATLWSAVKILHRTHEQLTGTSEEASSDGVAESQPVRVSGALAEHSLELKHQVAFLSQLRWLLGAIACAVWPRIDIFPNVRMGNPFFGVFKTRLRNRFLTPVARRSAELESKQLRLRRCIWFSRRTTLFVAFQLA